MKISIVTPCYNAEGLIEETMWSIIQNSAIVNRRAELDYIICDGGSRDNTLNIIDSVKSESRCNIQVLSESDNSMYEALGKGLGIATGDICAYINAGDFYSLHAFDIVLDIFENFDVEWLTGMSIIYNDRSEIISADLPFVYRSGLLGCGMYGRKLPYVMQEGTFWANRLTRLIDPRKLATFRLAGDYHMWHLFSQHSKLDIVKAHLGGFKFHDDQLSEKKDAYQAEVNRIISPIRIRDHIVTWFDASLWERSDALKMFYNPDIYFYEHGQKRYMNARSLPSFMNYSFPTRLFIRLIDRVLGKKTRLKSTQIFGPMPPSIKETLIYSSMNKSMAKNQ